MAGTSPSPLSLPATLSDGEAARIRGLATSLFSDNLSVSIGGQVVNPGDVMVGDDDGLVVFPRTRLEALIAGATAKLEAERTIMREIEGGALRQKWLHGVLTDLGVAV